MTTLRTAAQQALEALERYQVKRQDFDRFADEITALRAALAEPVQEPVAWGCFKDGELQSELIGTKADVDFWVASDEPHMQGMVSGPFYTAPPQRKPPATIDEMFDRMDKAPKGVFYGQDPMTIWMEAWRAAEQHHGIKEGT